MPAMAQASDTISLLSCLQLACTRVPALETGLERARALYNMYALWRYELLSCSRIGIGCEVEKLHKPLEQICNYFALGVQAYASNMFAETCPLSSIQHPSSLLESSMLPQHMHSIRKGSRA